MTSTVSDLRNHLLSTRPIAIDLFAGVGGLSLGLELAGFAIASHVEVDDTAARYAAYNFPLTNAFGGAQRGDVRNLSGADILANVSKGTSVALVAGGPPCQGFSLAGKKDRDDPLNNLVLEMARLVIELKPLAFIIENVPGMAGEGAWQFHEAIKRLARYYRVSDPARLYAPDFGVPQTRRRVIIIGLRRDLGLQPEHPKASHRAPADPFTLFSPKEVTSTVHEAIGDLPNVDAYQHLINGDEVEYEKAVTSAYQRVMRNQSSWAQQRGYEVQWNDRICTNCRRTRHGDDLSRRLGQLEPGQMDVSSGIRRLEANGLATTIRAGTTSERGSWSAPRPCHYDQPRVLTTRECARLQSFPDWFRFHPVKWHGNRQVGNAVPVLLARAVGGAILTQLGCVSRNEQQVPTVLRNPSLISEDIVAARSARLDARRITHQVVGTRKTGNASRRERQAGTSS